METATQVPRRMLGDTGETVSAIGLGGFHVGKIEREADAVALVRAALEAGVDFLDDSWDYHEGRSERIVGAALRDGYRERAFVMTKVDGQTRESATRQLNESLDRLGVEVIDLVQHHEVIRPEDPERILADDGAYHALVDAREAGLVRYIGFTGHKSADIHLKMLAAAELHGARFDTVQMPLNVLDGNTDGFERLVLPALLERRIACLGMKPLASGEALATGAVTAEECLRYALSLPVAVVITGCESMRDLEQALRVARGFEPLSKVERAELLGRTAGAAHDGRFERYKYTTDHDGTARRADWLG